MHLVRVRHLFYPDLPKDYIFELCQRQASLGYDLDLVTWNRRRRNLSTESMDGFRVWRVPGPNLAFGAGIAEFPFMPGLRKKVSSLRPEIVHAESHLFLSTAQAIRTAQELGVPGIVTVHGVMARRNAFVNFAQDAYIRTVGRRVFSGASRVICSTESDAGEIAGYGCPMAKISVVPNGVDSELFKPAGRPRDDLVVWTGRFVPEKGLPDFLRAAKIVSQEFSGVKFLLVGFGPERSKIEQMARDMRLTPGVVEFRGPVAREEIAQILRQATVFVLPSRKEGLPISILEAMASGKSIASYRIPAIERIITHGEDGLLAAQGDFEELASVIKILLLDDNLRAKLGERARSTALAKYSWDLVLHELDGVYKAELEARR